MKIVGVIQARMNSKRLPGKSIYLLQGKPLLYRFIERVKRATMLDEIVLATTMRNDDDILCDIAKELDIKVFRGSENDVMDRIYQAAVRNNADVIVRLCADNPLIEPKEIDRIINAFIMGGGYYMYSNTQNIVEDGEASGYPNGLGAEVYPMFLFKRMWEEVSDPQQREHPHRYCYENNLVQTILCPLEFAIPTIKLDVDTKEDYEKVKQIYDKFDNNNFHITDYLGDLIDVKVENSRR